MKNSLLVVFVLFVAVSCQRDKEEVQPEYENWYPLKAPIPKYVEAVHGDIDGTVVIATMFNVFWTNDRGKTWTESRYDAPISFGISGFVTTNDTLILLGGIDHSDSVSYAVNIYLYSIDKGVSWQRFKSLRGRRDKATLNIVTTPSGDTYRIKKTYTPVTKGTYTTLYPEIEGLLSSDGRLLKLPARQQTKSLYLDTKQRIYVAGSGPICGTSPNEFNACGDENGVVYISKQPVP